MIVVEEVPELGVRRGRGNYRMVEGGRTDVVRPKTVAGICP
ncbi:MAG: hypothetical protein ACXQTG_07040 [Methanoculleaceae archaeon]